MPSGSLTDANVGTAVPLCYGFVRVTGMQLAFFTNPPSTSTPTYPPISGTYPEMQIGLWAGGEGEWDGPDALWINGNRMFAYGQDGSFIGPNPTVGTIPPTAGSAYTSPLVGTLNSFNFHPGVDAAPLSAGIDNTRQGLDPLWSWFSNLVTPLRYSRVAYWAIAWTPQIGTSPGDMQPVCDMRTMRCRIFDGNGNQIDYRFTTNPIWHLVDVWLRRAVKPQFTIDPSTGPAALNSAELACFRWDIIAASAAYCDAILASGNPRFQGNYAFSAGSTLAAMEEQMLLCCRGYRQEIAGKLAFFCDQPRSSVFTIGGTMLVPATFQADDTQLHSNPNRYVGSYLEVNLPAISTISTISRTGGLVTIATTGPNPCAQYDLIIIGGVGDSSFNRAYLVASASGSTVTAHTTMSDTASSTGGSIGYLEARFGQRTPEAPPHLQHQLAIGQVVPPNAGGQRLKRVKVNYDFASSTWDQVLRVMLYERYRDLGADAGPYQPPKRVTLTLWSESVDIGGNTLWNAIPGSVVTLDPTTFYEYAGQYEVIEANCNPVQLAPQEQGGSFASAPASNSGTIQLVLWSFDEARFTDVSGVANASFATVPGSFSYAGTGVGWALTGGTVTLTGEPGPPGGVPYTVVVAWTGVTFSAPDGSIMAYNDGASSLQSNQTAEVSAYDPSNLGGQRISLYVSPATPPVGAHLLFTVSSSNMPASGTSSSYTI